MPERHVLYQYASCPFCHRVRQFLEGQGIDMELRDTLGNPAARRELVAGGGQGMVPCLRIERAGEVRWLYESMDIIDYLRRYHADESATISNHQTFNLPRGGNP